MPGLFCIDMALLDRFSFWSLAGWKRGRFLNLWLMDGERESRWNCSDGQTSKIHT
jgi:hypothetical protein